MTDTVIASIEWGTTSDLAFKAGWRVWSISVRPWEKVKKWQILATLSNQESSIQVDALWNIEQKLDDLWNSTNAVKMRTANLEKSTKKLYDKRLEWINANILSLQNTIEKAKQNLSNQKSTLATSFSTFAHDYDRVSSNMLYEGDKILWLTTNFEYANDGWEAYLGTRVWNAKSDADNKWGALYASRGKIRAYTESGVVISDINTAIKDLSDAYMNARFYATSMNFMLQNSVVGWWLAEDKLNGWVTSWLGFTSDAQQSESNFTTWKNGILSLTNANNGSWTVADKDITSLEFDLKNLEISRDTLLAEEETKIKEIQANVATAQSQNGQVSVQIAQTQMNNALAKESLEYNILRAPFDGIILEKLIDVWNVVWVWISAMKISSLDKSIIKTYIDNDMYRYTVWDTLTLTNISSNETFTGTLSLIQKEKDPLHNKNYVEVTLNTSSEVIGERMIVSLSRKKTPYQNGTIIPLESIITRYGTPWVFQIIDGKAKFTLVKMIGSDLSLVEVIGITEWATIITTWKENIIDGESLTPAL